jgi:hypothetical protein
MHITKFLDGFKFDPEARRVMSVAFEMTCAALRYTKRPDVAHEAVANRIIELAKNGVRNPDRRRSTQAAAALIRAASVGGLMLPRGMSAGSVPAMVAARQDTHVFPNIWCQCPGTGCSSMEERHLTKVKVEARLLPSAP